MPRERRLDSLSPFSAPGTSKPVESPPSSPPPGPPCQHLSRGLRASPRRWERVQAVVTEWKGYYTLMWEQLTKMGDGGDSERLRQIVMGLERDGEAMAERWWQTDRDQQAEGGRGRRALQSLRGREALAPVRLQRKRAVGVGGHGCEEADGGFSSPRPGPESMGKQPGALEGPGGRNPSQAERKGESPPHELSL